MTAFPQIFRVRQTFDNTCLDDIPGEIRSQLARLDLGRKVRPGESVAVTAGSRGVANIAPITRAIVEHLKGLGANPFVVPAMGSHAGGTAEGQRAFLAGYGITEESVGCPIRSSMETVVVGRAAEGFPIHFDRTAFEADHVFICNRVKPHTAFSGDIESGLMKMLMIGLGNFTGAETYHRAIRDCGFDQIIRSAASQVLARCHILAGLAIVENAYDRTARIEAVPPEMFESREKELLALAKRWMPRLPFQRVDVLLIDRIGKDISGTGLDSNVVGRKGNDHKAQPNEFPKVMRIALRGLTPGSHRNAIGMGIAEFCRSRLLREADLAVTRMNGLVSGHISSVMTPLDYETDREMLEKALGTIGLAEPSKAKLLWIADTLHLDEVECSAAYLEEMRDRDDLEILAGPRDLPFDAEGNFPESVFSIS
jgi:hypothetical protein